MVNINDVIAAINNTRIIEFQYTDSKGELSFRTGEPYEIRRGPTTDIFVFDVEKQEIRRFKAMRMSDLKITAEEFMPRFDLKP